MRRFSQPDNERKDAIETYKEEFIDFLVTHGALKFGEFTLKSGRKSPYFFTTGMFNAGASLYQLGYFYAAAMRHKQSTFDIIFGPAYKGIPLCVAMAMVLHKEFGLEKGYLYDRKEAKDYADKSLFVGCEPDGKKQILLIDDVMTTGKTKEDALDKLKAAYPEAKVTGLVIALNRQETDAHGENAIGAFQDRYGVPVHAIVTIREILEYLPNKEVNGKIYLDEEGKAKAEEYLRQYGV